ncbi:hypothetical protein ACZ90_52750 [Streptomyces albus subsp. albus]|nr:hypothetical protein ACZ90_52750 [Streptomyces albus subsp. albus]
MTPPAEHTGPTGPTGPGAHGDAGAYALGVLDPEAADRFEAHLAGCERCAEELDALLAVVPLLGEYAESAPTPETVAARPGPGLLDRLLAETAAVRRTRRRRRMLLAAAAVALIAAGPLATAALTSSDPPPRSAAPVRQMFDQGEKTTAVDPVTKVSATVSLQRRPWGTGVALRLDHVTGPRRCDLVAVGRNGERQVVTTWSVPAGGYGGSGGAAGAWKPEPLYAHGGAAFPRDGIDRFEVRTLDGELLVAVEV